ncbi:nucleotide-diphospho-sugar transferase [Tanacetum coccineum]
MEHSFLSQKGSGGGRGVKEKHSLMADKERSGVETSANKDGVAPSVMAADVTIVMGSFPPLSTLGTTTAGNAPGKSSYDNITGNPSGKKVNVRTLFTPRGNGIDVVVLVDSIRAISERFANTAYGSSTRLFSFQFSSIDGLDAMLENGPWIIQKNLLILKKWHLDENLLKEDVSIVPIWVKLHGVHVTAFSEDGLSAIATKLVMIELRADVELKDNIIVAMPKITKKCYYTCNVRVEHKWKPPRRSSCKVFGNIHEACLNNTGAGEKKTVNKPSQTSRGVLIGPKMGFKPQKQYRPFPKNPNAISSGNKKKGVKPTIKVSNSNSFNVLNSVDNDVEFGTNGRTTNLVNNGATSSGSSFMHVDNDGEFASNTPIGKKIDKIERQICEGKLRLLDNDGNPLVPTGIVESDSEVEVVFDETANLKISTSGKDRNDKGYGTNSLLEQWRDSYPDNDDYDPYDDDMYENPDLS